MPEGDQQAGRQDQGDEAGQEEAQQHGGDPRVIGAPNAGRNAAPPDNDPQADRYEQAGMPLDSAITSKNSSGYPAT